jgi:hypothetical protein
MSAERKAHRRRKLLVAAGSLAAALLAGEVLVRLVVGAPLPERLPILMMQANEHRGWEMVPNHVHYTYQHAVHVNSLGLRGPELSAKGPGEVRVLALGDSLVYGQGVAEDETLPAFLERALLERDRERDWTVVNAGHRAYDTFQELALLEELGPRIAPDVVVLFWYWNDLHERDTVLTHKNLKDRGVVAFDTGDRVEGWDRLRWQSKQFLRRSALMMFAYDMLGRSQDPSLPAQYAEKRFAKLAGYLDRFRSLGTSARFEPLFAVIPDPNVLAGRMETRPLVERALSMAAERGLATLDLQASLEPLYREIGELPVLPFDGHYRPEANRAMAAFLAERLLEIELSRSGG